MEISNLKIFLAIADYENIHKASDVLGFSVSRMSKVLSKIEADLNVQLFDRKGKRLFLNESGAAFYQEVKSTIRHFDKACQIAQKGKSKFKINLATSAGVFHQFTVPLIKKILNYFPMAEFDISTVSNLSIAEGLSSGKFDLIVTAQDIDKKKYTYKKLGNIKFNILADLSHPLAEREYVHKFKDLLKHDFVLPHDRFFQDSSLAKSGDGWRDDLYPRKSKFSVDSLSSLLDILNQGIALSFLPTDFEKRYKLAKIEVDNIPFQNEFEVYLACKDSEQFGWSKLVF